MQGKMANYYPWKNIALIDKVFDFRGVFSSIGFNKLLFIVFVYVCGLFKSVDWLAESNCRSAEAALRGMRRPPADPACQRKDICFPLINLKIFTPSKAKQREDSGKFAIVAVLSLSS
jgi:hypothetical protein